ncbi:hypothetical protein AB0G05_11355 [Nonomuraea wenchangensis]
MTTYEHDGLKVLYDVYEDGRLWEAAWPFGTHGSIVNELIEMIPSTALDIGEGWAIDEDAERTFAAYWEPNL